METISFPRYGRIDEHFYDLTARRWHRTAVIVRTGISEQRQKRTITCFRSTRANRLMLGHRCRRTPGTVRVTPHWRDYIKISGDEWEGERWCKIPVTIRAPRKRYIFGHPLDWKTYTKHIVYQFESLVTQKN